MSFGSSLGLCCAFWSFFVYGGGLLWFAGRLGIVWLWSFGSSIGLWCAFWSVFLHGGSWFGFAGRLGMVGAGAGGSSGRMIAAGTYVMGLVIVEFCDFMVIEVT